MSSTLAVWLSCTPVYVQAHSCFSISFQKSVVCCLSFYVLDVLIDSQWGDPESDSKNIQAKRYIWITNTNPLGIYDFRHCPIRQQGTKGEKDNEISVWLIEERAGRNGRFSCDIVEFHGLLSISGCCLVGLLLFLILSLFKYFTFRLIIFIPMSCCSASLLSLGAP